MTREETLAVMGVLKAAYPSYYRGMTKADAESVVGLWSAMFADDDPALVAAAVKALIVASDREFPPLIGTVKEKMRQLTAKDEMTDAEAWALVAKAVKNGIWGAEDEFHKLPPDVRRIVGTPSQLRDWARMDSSALHSVVASNFQRAYRVRTEKNREVAKLPSDVKKAISAMSERMALGDGAK